MPTCTGVMRVCMLALAALVTSAAGASPDQLSRPHLAVAAPNGASRATSLATSQAAVLRGGLRRPTLRRSSRARVSAVAAIPAPTQSAGANVPATFINLVKAVVGSGVLSLPAAVAAFSSSKAAVAPSVAILIIAAAISGYCFALVARTCAATGTRTWEGAWEQTMSKSTTWLPNGLIVCKCFVACLAYTMVIGDAFSSIFAASGFPAALAGRTSTILMFASLFLLPLSLLPSLEMLKYTSFAGMFGILYTLAFMAPRFAAAGAAGLTGALDAISTPKVFILLSVLATAFTAHYSAPRMFAEFAPMAKSGEPASPAKVKRFCALVAMGFGTAGAISASLMALGYSTFGGACSGLILNNYAPIDALAKISRVAVGASIVCTYPIAFHGLRDGALGLAGVQDPSQRTKLALTLALGTLCA
ncbi:transmembrane amino acid transporter protein-domain-containing protein, partial [Pavlovales sp. CCMP2436]